MNYKNNEQLHVITINTYVKRWLIKCIIKLLPIEKFVYIYSVFKNPNNLFDDLKKEINI